MCECNRRGSVQKAGLYFPMEVPVSPFASGLLRDIEIEPTRFLSAQGESGRDRDRERNTHGEGERQRGHTSVSQAPCWGCAGPGVRGLLARKGLQTCGKRCHGSVKSSAASEEAKSCEDEPSLAVGTS